MPFEPPNLSRRQLLVGAAALGVLPLGGCRRRFDGTLSSPSIAWGHQLRGEHGVTPTRTVQTEVVVLGGGIAGLAAGWQLKRRGTRDFLTLELEGHAGGNSSSGSNSVSAYPLGAHYVPIINEDLVPLRTLFEELGVIRGYGAKDLPLYEEAFLCSEPVERLYSYGRWQEGLMPRFGLKQDDLAQIERFRSLMRQYKSLKGKDGKRAFAMPLDASSRDPDLLALDRQSMRDFLAERGFSSPHLLWYVNYCCRDDYGADLAHTSAWAGVHYFAARAGRAANAEPGAILTWPEGNGWLVRALADSQKGQLRRRVLVHRAETVGDRVHVDYFDLTTNEVVRVEARAAVCALPRFVAAKVVPGLDLPDFHYAPWVVANVTLRRPPGDGLGARLSWDNVSRHGPSLGYVVANHQGFGMQRRETVITYYRPFTDMPPAAARQIVGTVSHEEWAASIVAELERMHPGLGRDVLNLDVWVWAHGMIRPDPGMIWGDARARALEPRGRIHFAHSDMSGISVFEEAFLRGVGAANSALATGERSA